MHPRTISIALLAVVNLAAMTMSYAALADVAAGHLTHPWLGWLFPVVVDGSIIAATISTVTLARSAYAWVTLVGAAAISVATNAVHGWQYGPLGVAVAVVPPVATLALTQLVICYTREHQAAAPRSERPSWMPLRDAAAPDLAGQWRASRA